METTAENRTMPPGDRWEPGDIYMMLSPTGTVQDISIDDRLYKSFGDFLNEYARYAVENARPPHTNDFLVHYRFDEPTGIPAWNEEEEPLQVYYKRLETVIQEQRLKPLNTCRLYPAMYCYQNGLDPLLPENSLRELKKSQNYQFAASQYSGYEWDYGYKGIQTDRGVVLFDNTERGETLHHRYKSFFLSNFFDARLDITFLRMIELIPTEKQKANIRSDITLLGPFGVLPANCYTDLNELGIYTESEYYDMAPTLENFMVLSRLDRGVMWNAPEDVYDIRCLLQLASPQNKEPVIPAEYPNVFYYRKWFAPLADRFAKAGSEREKAQVMAFVRDMAGDILRNMYPDRRQLQKSVSGPQEQRKAAVPAQTVVRQLPDVAKKLAKQSQQSKKKNGVNP